MGKLQKKLKVQKKSKKLAIRRVKKARKVVKQARKMKKTVAKKARAIKRIVKKVSAKKISMPLRKRIGGSITSYITTTITTMSYIITSKQTALATIAAKRQSATKKMKKAKTPKAKAIIKKTLVILKKARVAARKSISVAKANARVLISKKTKAKKVA